jgi:PAS domain S-box-containing protein
MKKLRNIKKEINKSKPARNNAINMTNSKQIKVYEILKSTTHNLNERVKELNCLYSISNILNEPSLPAEKIYNRILKVIISSYQYPEITVVKLNVDGNEYKTKYFKETIWKQSKPIIVRNKKIGELEICYLKKCKKADEGPFLKEERHLINSIAQLLSQFIGRKRIENALQQSESRFRTLIEKAPVAISLSRSGLHFYTNKMFLKMFGYKRNNEIIGRPLLEQFAQQCREEISVRTYRREQNLPVPDVYESVGLNKKGSEFPIHITVARVNLEDGPASIGFFSDITERKKAEEEIKESREQLKNFAAHLQTIREEERTYISRELHDNLGQSLTALRIDLHNVITDILEKNVSGDLNNIIKQSYDLISIIDSTIQSMRNIARELRPSILDNLGLLAAIEWQIREFSKRSGMKCRLNTTLNKINVEAKHSIGIFRIIQESLTNVLRHSKATMVSINIFERETNTIIVIKDNGCGINKNDIVSSKSLGLLGMRERALIFGGELLIKGDKTSGTKITIKIPITKK